MAQSVNSTGFSGLHVTDNTADQTARAVVDASGYLHQVGTRITKTAAQINLMLTGQSGYGIYCGSSTVATIKRVETATHGFSTIYGLFGNVQRGATVLAASYPHEITCKASGTTAKFVGVNGRSVAGMPTQASSAATFYYLIIGT